MMTKKQSFPNGFQELRVSYGKSLERFAEVLKKEKTIENRDASIQRFEFTIELAWKAIQKFLRGQEIVCRSPKECLDEAFKFGLVEDDPRWPQMLEDRNLTSHTYDEEIAEQVHGHFSQYLPVLQSLKEKLNQ